MAERCGETTLVDGGQGQWSVKKLTCSLDAGHNGMHEDRSFVRGPERWWTNGACGHRGAFKPRFICGLEKGHDGPHEVPFKVPTAEPFRASRMAQQWSVEEGRTEDSYDVFCDRRPAAYDLDLNGAVGFIKQHRDFKSGDRITILRADGTTVSAS